MPGDHHVGVMRSPDRTRTLLVLGDSVAAGMGALSDSYATVLADYLSQSEPWNLVNLAASARMLQESRLIVSQCPDVDAQLVVIHHGITEAIIRPVERSLRYLPARWRRMGWMDPRPYYSRAVHRRIAQKLESAIRWRVKVALIRSAGGYRLQTPDVYQTCLAALVEDLLTRTDGHILLPSHCGIDERFFPQSLSSLDEFSDANKSVAQQFSGTGRVRFVDVRTACAGSSAMLADGFHPSASGHQAIALQLFHAYRTITQGPAI